MQADEVLNEGEVVCLLENAEPGLIRTRFALIAATGLRPEEAYALTWGDIGLGDESGRLRHAIVFLVARRERGRPGTT